MISLVKDSGLIRSNLASCCLFEATALPGELHIGIVFDTYTWPACRLTRTFEHLWVIDRTTSLEYGSTQTASIALQLSHCFDVFIPQHSRA